MGSASLTERVEDGDNPPVSKLLHHAIFASHNQGDGVKDDPRSILRMMIERNDTTWANIRFESKTQSI